MVKFRQSSDIAEHSLDVMRAALRFAENKQKFAIAVIHQTEGGAVRDRGAMMAVSETGESAGYLSGGCIDSDVRRQAVSTTYSQKVRRIRYGAGSPFLDIQLPCGGAIDLTLVPCSKISGLKRAVDQLEQRCPVQVIISEEQLQFEEPAPALVDTHFQIRPKLKMRVAGKGCEPVAMVKLAEASGIEIEVWSPDAHCIRDVQNVSDAKTVSLASIADLPNFDDDKNTAFILMFHDQDWEVRLLKQALEGDAFFVGAVGSRKTHEKRIPALKAQGISDLDIKKIKAPIGLVPSMRDASMLAVSALAEVIDAYHHERHSG